MKILNALKRIIGQLLSLIFVPRCSSCGLVLESKERALCQKCEQMYLTESKMLCSGCGRAHRVCSCRIRFLGSRIPFLHVTGYDVKRNSASKNMILSIKDNNIPSAFDFLAEEMLRAFNERYIRLFQRANVIVTYVPRSKKARRRAGHDQSEQLAMRIAEKSGAVFMPLFKNAGQKAQKKLSGTEREENARQNYSLLSPELNLRGQIIIVVDDIVTTGASIGACASLVRSVGARAVIALSAAKSEYKKGIVPENEEEIL